MSSVQEQFQNVNQHWVPSDKSAHLLKSLSRMQECKDIPAFCRVTLEEIETVFGPLKTGLFIQISKNDSTGEIDLTDGVTGVEVSSQNFDRFRDRHSDIINQALIGGRSTILDNVAVLSLVKEGTPLGMIFLQAAGNWQVEDKFLLEQFALNGARCLETTTLLEEARRLAYRDVLTNIGNRINFKKEIQSAINKVDDAVDLKFVVLQFVLDTLPELNVALGHSMGDELLKCVAGELKRLFPEAISIARTSGDGFGICVDIRSADELSTLPEVINELFDVYLPDIKNLPHLTPRIGMSVYPQDGTNADQLWKNASIALANTKKPGTANFCLYDRHIVAEINERVRLNNALRDGLSNDQLSLNYQPQICLQTGRLTGVEALLRWQNEAGEFVPADIFIPIAEASGLLGPISDWVLKQACLQRQEWTAQGVPEFPVAVNISLNEFQSEDFVPQVRTILTDTGMPAHLLDIELTESVIMQDRGQTKRNMLRLKGLGARLSIDDFGTGYSSLSYLSHLPASVLKIDKSFIDGIVENSADAAIARTIITLGHNLGMKVLAEGVESQPQIEFLQAAGCQEGQGFIFSQPVRADKIPDLAKVPDFLNRV